MADNQPPDRPADRPALPAPQPLPALPPDIDVDEYRRFQEFQRFQNYERFVEQGGGTHDVAPPGAVARYPGTPLHGGATGGPPAPAQHEIAEQLAGVRQHLADLATIQAHINRTINPPLWRRILRSQLIHRLIWLGVIAIIGIWGVPLLIDNLLSDHNNADSNGTRLLPVEESGILGPDPRKAVAGVYRFVAGDFEAQACFSFTNRAESQFAMAANAPDCEHAVNALAKQVTNRNAYANPSITQLPEPKGQTDTISSCEFAVSGGPRLGTFTLTQQDVGWEITNYTPPAAACPTPTTPTN